MALKAIINALTDVSEGLRGEYRAGSKEEGLEGKFVLDVAPEGGFSLEDVSGLKTALSTERGEVARLKAATKDFEGLDPKDVRTKLDRLADLEKIDPAKEADKIAEAKAQAKIEQLVAQHGAETGKLTERNDKLLSGIKRLTIDAAIENALADADALNSEALRLKLKNHLRLKETGNDDNPFEVEVVTADGNPMVGDSKGGSMTPSGMLNELRKDAAWATSFKPAGKPGAGAEQGRGNGGDRAMSRAQFDALDPAAKMKAMAEGATLHD